MTVYIKILLGCLIEIINFINKHNTIKYGTEIFNGNKLTIVFNQDSTNVNTCNIND